MCIPSDDVRSRRCHSELTHDSHWWGHIDEVTVISLRCHNCDNIDITMNSSQPLRYYSRETTVSLLWVIFAHALEVWKKKMAQNGKGSSKVSNEFIQFCSCMCIIYQHKKCQVNNKGTQELEEAIITYSDLRLSWYWGILLGLGRPGLACKCKSTWEQVRAIILVAL